MCVGEAMITYFLKCVTVFVHIILFTIKWSNNGVRNVITDNFQPIVVIFSFEYKLSKPTFCWIAWHFLITPQMWINSQKTKFLERNLHKSLLLSNDLLFRLESPYNSLTFVSYNS